MCRKGKRADKIRPEEAKEAKITETHTGIFLKKISEKLERLANGDAGRKDITFSQGKVLWFLHRRENEGVTTMRDIEKFFDCSHATVSGIVSRLAEKGYVSLEPDKNDRRATNVSLTEKERKCFSQMLERQRTIEEKLLGGFSPGEKQQFSEYLSRIYANLGGGTEGGYPRLTGEKSRD